MSDRIPVVTAFVCSGNRIALMKRSRRVSTYQGAWAAFSGYLEQIPLNQAYTELDEEAGLSREDVSLRGIGVPLPVDDPPRSWLVLPFLFELREGAEIRTDWETEEWGWFHETELDDLETVPGLSAALRRVWPPFGDDRFWRELSATATDKVHGATELARRGLTALGGFVQERSELIGHADLVRSTRAFAACRPTMGVFPDLAARLLLAISREGGQFGFDALVSEMLAMVNDATALSADNASEALEGKRLILTLSDSEAVRRTILGWSREDCEVCVAESHPGGEGVTLASRLRSEGIRVSIVADRDIAATARSVDAVLVGCDAITEDDGIINKVGTRAAVSSAGDAGVPAYAVAQTFKVVPPGWPFFIEEWDGAGESGHSEHVRMGTAVFDETPWSEFTTILTEEGTLTTARLEELRSELGSAGLLSNAGAG